MTNSIRRSSRQGSVLLLVVAALAVLCGIVGLALDVGMMYCTKQLAQAAADAAAQAGVIDMYNGTNTGSNAFGASTVTCPTSGGVAPCQYAQLNGFNTAADTVTLKFNNACTVPGGATLSSDSVNVICVTVSRTVATTFMQVVGPTSSTVSATATAGILSSSTATPIGVLHPTLTNSLNNSGTITITGGIQRSIQVNSNAASAFSAGTIDLSKAGPTGNGGDFAVVGGPLTKPAGISLGTAGSYVSHASTIQDPLAAVTAPSRPTFSGTSIALANGQNGCPSNPKKACVLYFPGVYGGIDSKDELSVFAPGIYYITSSGFIGDANGAMIMATGCTDGSTISCGGQTKSGTNTGWTGNMLVYNAGTTNFSFGANFGSKDCGVTVTCGLVGSPTNSSYEGILFFQSRSAGSSGSNTFISFGGGGALSLTGTIYATNASQTGYPSKYQNVSFGGGSGSSTTVIGSIITDTMSLSNNTSITMTLNSTSVNNVRQVALLN